MNDIWNRHNLFYRISASALIILHLVTFGPIREAFAFSATSANYKLSSGALNAGGNTRSASTVKLWQDVVGEPCVGRAQSTTYLLNAGFISTIQSDPPYLSTNIPYQSWPMNSSKTGAFDLDNYFSSPDSYTFTYSVSGNSKISVSIDPATHVVSFSQPQDWFGVEKVYFTAIDSENNIVQSNKVVLQVENTVGADQPVITDISLTPTIIKEGDLIKLTVRARDLDNDALTFSYSNYFTETAKYKDGDFWVSEATWQAGASSAGHYPVTVTVKDPTLLSDSTQALVNVGNFNHPPVLNPIADITANEGDLVVITPTATDPDNDALTYYFSSPFDAQGKWLPGYDDSGTYNVRVTASDGIDTVSTNAKVIINHKNRAPAATLNLTKTTVAPSESFTITLTADDPDKEDTVLNYQIFIDANQIDLGAISNHNSVNKVTSLANEGYYKVTVKVTDSGGLEPSPEPSVNLQVAVPKTVSPIMGDFNGDSLTDLGTYDPGTGKWEVALSQKEVFQGAQLWLSGFGNSSQWSPTGGDFNGDGKSDIAIYNSTTGEFQVALSTGSSFSTPSTWLTVPNASVSWQAFTGNFNGDKYTDFAVYNRDTGAVRVALGTGTGFGALNTWMTGFGTGYIALAGDFNGDSLTDLCLFKKDTGEFKVAFSNTKAFVDGTSWISGFAAGKDPLLSDFNNDGLTDVGYWEQSSGNWYYALSTGATFVNKGLWLTFGASSDEYATTGDFDGNGVIDTATFDKDKLGIARWTTQISNLKPADLLTEIDNGIGGKTQITYTYAAASDNPLLPFPVYVASTVSLVNTYPADRAASHTQNFLFSGGYYDAVEREFRGFAKVVVTDPITNNYSETYFFQGKDGQDGALKGQIDKIISYDGNGRQISSTQNTYEVKKSGPQEQFLGFPALKESTTTIYEENASYITTDNKFTYDNIGNLITERDEGDVAKVGDEKSTTTTYAQAYDVGFNRPLETALLDKDGAVVSKKAFDYDTHGNLSRDIVYAFSTLYPEPRALTTSYSYDSFGNLKTTTNDKGSTVTTDYETDFYAYPQTVTNSLGQSVSYVYDPKLGVVTSATDANGVISSATYDSLGRPLHAMRDNGSGTQITAVTYSYPDFNTKITTNAIGLSATEYIDGLGRKYKAVSVGEDGTSARQVSSEVYFNNRGAVDKESLSHYIDEDPNQISYVQYVYDIRGRVLKTISDFPGTSADAESSISYISPLYVETTDPQGHRKGTQKDVYGNIIEVTEFTQGGVYKTDYEYDIQGNLVKTTDSKGNITQIFYDSIGRKLNMIDPDMGTWSYEYDILGNLIKQTDAKNQVLEFEYDSLNRLTRKLANSQTLATYTYDDTTKANCIGRLSKVTDQSGSTEFFYDKLGREIKSIKTIDAAAYTVERTYDVLDRLVTLKYPDAETVTYSYDANSGLLEKVQGSATYVQDIKYNAKGQMNTVSYGNGVTTNYTYGQDLRLSRILTQSTVHSPQTTLQDLNYIFDKNGNLNTLTDNLRSNIRTYAYDELDRLTEAHNTSSALGGYTDYFYQYDSIGNMLSKTANDGSEIGAMTYGQNAGPHALTSAGGYAYQYDANGNMIVGKTKTLSYDAENRLTEVNELGIITTFTYDGDGGRVKKSTVNGPQTTATTYIGSLFEKDSSGKTTKHIFAGANRIASVESTGNTFYYHSDHLGSSNVITDKNGVQVQYCEYTPYGSLARNEGTDAVTHKFTGKELDSTGLYFYGARYYDPEIGRFISADTIVQAPFNPQTLNRYSYCGNNPINYVDPSGHFFWFIPLIIAAVKAVAAYAMAHSLIVLAGAALNVALNASNIHNFGNFMTYAAIGAVSAAVGGGIGAAIGGGGGALSSPFWGTVVGGFTGGFIAGVGNAEYAGANFTGSLKSGLITGGISAGTAAVFYGAVKVGETIASSAQEASAVRTQAAGVKVPVGEQGNGSPAAALKPDVSSTVSKTQALSSKGPAPIVKTTTSNNPVLGAINKYGSVDFSFDAGTGVFGISGQISITGSGVSGRVGVGWGIGTGVSVTGGAVVGKSSGWGVTFSATGGEGFGGTISGAVSQGGNAVNGGVGVGVGAGASVTVGYEGDLIKW